LSVTKRKTLVKKKYLTRVFLYSTMTQVDKWKVGIYMEKIVKQSLLYDFYGELLTEHQKSVYEDYVLNDIGISEIAEERGISRQGVHDLIKRCDKILDGYEEKLHLLERFSQVKEDVSDMKNSIAKIKCDNLDESDKELVNEVINKLESIIDKL